VNLLPIIGTMDMLSAPPAMITSPMPAMICWLAVAMLCKPLEQKRLTVCPAVVTGIPARSATMRAMFMPCSASGKAQPSTMSCTSFLSMPLRSITALITAAASSSGRVVRSAPFGAFPTAVRAAATITALRMCVLP
jgi:hypothetical protein